MGTVFVILFLLAVSGLIAYIGDLLGRRMGKKRLSAFGLRPKHTAILFTCLTGVLIAGVSLGAAYGASPGVRLALTEGERLVLRNATLRHSLRALRDDYLELSRVLSAKQEEIQRLQRDEETLRAQNSAMQEQTRRLKAQFGELTASVRRLQTVNAGVQQRNEQLSRANRALAARQAQLQGAVGRLQVANNRLQKENGRLEAHAQRAQAEQLAQKAALAQVIARHREQVKALETKEASLRSRLAALEGSNTRLARANAGLTGENNTLATRNRQLTSQQKTLAASLEQANRQVAAAQGQLKSLQDGVDSLRHTAERLRTNNLIFAESEEVARRVVPANPPPEVIRSQIETLMFEVRHLAAERKAAPDAAHRECAYLAPYPLPDGRVLREEGEIVRLLLEQTSRLRDSIILRAIADENCVIGDPVPVVIQAFPNQLVLRKGEEIASERIYGGESEGTVLEDLVGFLRNGVRLRAVGELGMIPGPMGEIGEMRFDPLLEVMRKVREIGGWAKVGAVARQDTWSAGQLHVDFYVVPETQGEPGR
jgi:hypothetical protein